MAPAVPGSLEEYKLKARATRGHLTRSRTSLAKACDNLNTNPSAWARTEAEDIYTRLKSQYELLMDLYQTCLELDDDTEATVALWEAKVNDVSAEVDVSRAKIHNALATMDQKLAQAQAQAQATAQAVAANTTPRVRVVDTLKPFVLSLQNTPVEYRNWKRKLDSFFSASNLAHATVPDQQAYVRQFIESDLDARISVRIMPSTAINGSDSLVSFLDEVFEQRYPLFTRRLDFFRLIRTSGMTTSEYLAKMLQLSGEADLASLTTDNLLVYQVFTGINEDSLFAKLLELEDPTFQDVQKKIAVWEASKSAKKSVHQGAEAKATNGPNRGRNRGRDDKPSERHGPATNTPTNLAGMCLKCGNKKHKTKDCPRTELVCNNCKKPGHTVVVCLDTYNKANPRNRAATPAPPRATSRACLLYTSPSPRDKRQSRMPSSA